jgi:hypothetical protein
MALLKLRGQEQFNRERGAHLYVQLRSQIVSLVLKFLRSSVSYS